MSTDLVKRDDIQKGYPYYFKEKEKKTKKRKHILPFEVRTTIKSPLYALRLLYIFVVTPVLAVTLVLLTKWIAMWGNWTYQSIDNIIRSIG